MSESSKADMKTPFSPNPQGAEDPTPEAPGQRRSATIRVGRFGMALGFGVDVRWVSPYHPLLFGFPAP